MGRAPCCEKVGLKKGPWTTEEDQILINYINQHGSHGNWRKLPKQAGLLRCGKSCRLRWINYLRPDIKRGNFTKEEEDTIIKLHQELGNKWSAVAARLPGRTDNEIKNVWNTHLKKRLVDQVHTPPKTKKRTTKRSKTGKDTQENPKPLNSTMQDSLQSSTNMPNSPSHSSNENSSVTMAATDGTEVSRVGPSDLCGVRGVQPHAQVGQSNASDGSLTPDGTSASELISDTLNKLLEMEEDFCRSDEISGDCSSMTFDVQSKVDGFEFDSKMDDDDMEFWYDIYTRDGELAELLQEL